MQDCYSGGMVMPDRNFSYENYGFAFNGKLKDNEVKGEGNHYDYGERLFDPRVVRFLSVDPFQRKYAWYTPYQFAGNKFIAALDLDGLEDIVFHDIDNAKRVAKVDINKIGLLVTSGNNRIHQSQLLNSNTINSLYQKGNTTLYIDRLPKDDGSVQFKFISQKKYSKTGFKLEIQYNVSLQNATDLQDAVKTTNSDQDLYSIIGVPFDLNETYLSEGTQLTKFLNSKGNTVASGAAGGSYVWINPEYFGASPTYTTNEGQPHYTFQLSGNETIVHELGHNLVPKSDHDPNNTGNPIYPNNGLKSNQPGAVYPTTDDTKKILSQNLKRIRRK